MQFQPRQLGDHSYFAHLQIDEIDSFYASVVASGAEISKTIRDEPWGMREFGLATVDGHRIMFAAVGVVKSNPAIERSEMPSQ